MKSLDFDTRSLIAKECINRVCEAAGLKTADKKRRTEKRIARMLADAPNMGKFDRFWSVKATADSNRSITENAGVDVNLSITSAHLNLIVAESGEHLAKHEMPNISFASGGDTVCDCCLVFFIGQFITCNLHFSGHFGFCRLRCQGQSIRTSLFCARVRWRSCSGCDYHHWTGFRVEIQRVSQTDTSRTH